jgi:hypothetical protein
MKIKFVSVSGLELKISLNNNILSMSCNIDGLSIFDTRRTIRNSRLANSEIFEKIDSDWVSKIFAVNINQIKNTIKPNIHVIKTQSQTKQFNELPPASSNF